MTTQLNARVGEVTERIIERSRPSRQAYLARIDRRGRQGTDPQDGSVAPISPTASPPAARATKRLCATGTGPISRSSPPTTTCCRPTSPTQRFPDLIKEAARAAGGTAQVAGGVPAMCDGVTQGETGMELSLFSRDVIALSTAVALSHDMFDAAVYLGICDKIVPGLLIGALSFGHLPAVFLPAGPMTSGLSNDEKSKIRQLYAEGKATRAELLDAEAEAYHAPGHLHLLRHRQHQPDADGDHGPASAGRVLRQSEHAAARRADDARREARAGAHRARQSVHADRACHRRARDRQRRRRAARDRRLDQSHHPSGRHGRRRGHCAEVGGFRRPRRSHAAADAHLSERQGRREPFPRRRRHGAS